MSTRLAHTRVADRREDRAIYHLAHGDLRAALHLDALAVLCLPLLLWRFVASLVVRNLPWTPFTALRV